MSRIKTLTGGIFAGFVIGIGGTVYMSCSNKIVGAFLFSVGLFCICVFGFNLFTGKIGYVIENKGGLDCFFIWLGNLIGCMISGELVALCKPELRELAASMIDAKFSQYIWQTAALAFFCGILMYIAVENYKSNGGDFGRYIGIFTCVPVFILCGFEHSVADMFYFVLGVRSLTDVVRGLGFIAIVSVFNGVGAIAFREISVRIKQS